MTAKRKRRKPKSERHIAVWHSGTLQTPLRVAFELLLIPFMTPSKRWVCPTIGQTADRLSGGRATVEFVRTWLNGRRRAPAWFVAVVADELEARRDRIDSALTNLATVYTGDRRRGPIASARAREQRLRELGRLEAEKRMGEAINTNAPGKNDP